MSSTEYKLPDGTKGISITEDFMSILNMYNSELNRFIMPNAVLAGDIDENGVYVIKQLRPIYCGVLSYVPEELSSIDDKLLQAFEAVYYNQKTPIAFYKSTTDINEDVVSLNNYVLSKFKSSGFYNNTDLYYIASDVRNNNELKVYISTNGSFTELVKVV